MAIKKPTPSDLRKKEGGNDKIKHPQAGVLSYSANIAYSSKYQYP